MSAPAPVQNTDRLATDLARLATAHSKPRCLHLRFSGRRCGSPALRGRPYCYFHAKQREPQPLRLYLSQLDDPTAIQFNIARVMNAYQAGRMSRKDAYLYVAALQVASGNLRNVEKELALDEPVTQSDLELLAAEGFGASPEAADAQAKERGELVGDEKECHEDGEANDSGEICKLVGSSVPLSPTQEDELIMRKKRSTRWRDDVDAMWEQRIQESQEAEAREQRRKERAEKLRQAMNLDPEEIGEIEEEEEDSPDATSASPDES